MCVVKPKNSSFTAAILATLFLVAAHGTVAMYSTLAVGPLGLRRSCAFRETARVLLCHAIALGENGHTRAGRNTHAGLCEPCLCSSSFLFA